MPGKLLSDADLESDTALGKMEIPRKQNEKVPPRAEGRGARQDERPGRLGERGRGVRRGGVSRLGARGGAALTGLVRRPAWVSVKERPGVVVSAGDGRAAALG